MKEKCPFLTSCLVGSCTTKLTEQNLTLRSRPTISAKPTIGTIISILAYQTKPRTMSNLQELNSLQMWLSSCKRQLFSKFNHMGLSVGINATKNTIDRIRENFDAEAKKWKNQVTDYLLMPSDISSADTIPYAEDSDQPMSLDNTPLHSPERKTQHVRQIEMSSESDADSQQCPTTSDISSSTGDTKGKPGFSICFDNVNQRTTVRHQTRDKKNKMFNMVQAYAALDRINSIHLQDIQPTPNDILSIPLQNLLPNEMDEVDLRSEMTVMVERILCDKLTCFSDLHDQVTWHIAHAYSQQSTKKSQTVLLGVIDKDESKVGDTIDILEEYQKFVPLKPDGSPLVLPLHADGLSCERVNDAQNARLNGTNPWTQLQGFIPDIQEWHKRCLLLQDIYDELYSGKSSREKGTLFHLKNYFEQRNVTGNVKSSFNYNEDFLEFCTEGYVTLLAMKILSLDGIEEIPEDLSDENKRKVLSDVASKIIDQVFQSPAHTVQQILRCEVVQEEAVYPFCTCKTEKPGETMVFCDNRNCSRGVWFHLECVNMDDDDIPDNAWYCSQECEQEKSTKRKRKRKTVADNLVDHKMNYALLLVWKGLSQLVRKDAIRENNGRLILTH